MNQYQRLSGNLYGITHDQDGNPRITEPNVIKVSIGLAKGKAINIYIDRESNWVIQTGSGQETKRKRLETKDEARREYYSLKPQVPERKYPERLPYFTFSHLVPSGEYEPDFDVIEAHGPLPTEIEIAFIWDDPFAASYQLWTAAEKKCEGDGRDAFRINSAARTAKEKEFAAQAEQQGEKYFPILGGCSEYGCQYCKSQEGKPPLCRPLGTLKFQLINSPRLGGTAYLHTTGYQSIRQLFSSIQIFKKVAGANGHITGIPLTMTLSPYTVKHDGRKATQYCVNLEFRKKSAIGAGQSFLEYAAMFQPSGAEPQKQLQAGPDPAVTAESIDAEFDTGELDPEPPAQEPSEQEPDGIPEISPEELLPEETSAFYTLCRSLGMTDTIILDKVGQLGFETLQEIKPEAIPGLVTWAKEWVPGGSKTDMKC